ncbi:hypothetical protein OnM2_075004 [Erysiphe neolycopersici]|uniref:Polyamine transport protein n=1 Tax=Erysiphe neolycopersici TaxID=212602 RepID=A0A420HIV6_9PEZI|nr:hypothetical protein OnM2_075004 [Erysiphe neolycopersici]
MSPKTDSLSQPIWLKIQNSSVDYSDSPRIKDDIKFRIRSLLISRNNRYPPRTPRPSIERLRCYANSHKKDFLRPKADLPISTSSIYKSTSKYRAIRNNSDPRESTRLNSIRNINEENLISNKEPVAPSILDAQQGPIGENCSVRPEEDISRSLSLDKIELQGLKKIHSQNNNINHDIRSHSTTTSTDENSLHQLQHQLWSLYNPQLVKSSFHTPKSISPEFLISPSDLSCFIGGCSPGHCNSKSHRRDSSWSAVRKDDKFQIFRCHDNAMSAGITNRLGSERKDSRINLSADLLKSNRMSKSNDPIRKETFINEKLQSIKQTGATSGGTSGSTDIFPHALRSLEMAPKEIKGPIYSTTFSTNFSLPAAKTKNLDSMPSRKETTKIWPEPKPSVNSNNSNNRYSRKELSDNSIRSRHKTPSLISTVSRKSARHGLLKPSITDTRPIDMGLAISPILTHDIIYPNNFNEEIVYSEAKAPILENEKVLQSDENEISLPPSTTKFKKLRKINNDSSEFIVKSLSSHSLKSVTPQTVDATSRQSFVDRYDSNNSDSVLDTIQSATMITSENLKNVHEIFPYEKKKDKATVTQLEITPNSQPNIADSLKTFIKSGFSQGSQTEALKTELIINAETEPLNPETVWWRQDLRQQKSIEYFDSSLVQSDFLTSMDKGKNSIEPMNDSRQDGKSSILERDHSEKLAIYPEMEKMNQETTWNKNTSKGYASVPNQEYSGANILNVTSIGPNSSQNSKLCSKLHQKRPITGEEMELDLISSAESFKSVKSTRNNNNLVNFEHSNGPENQENESQYKNTVNWLRNLISSNDDLESRLTALPPRSIRVQGLLENPKSNIANKNDDSEQLLSVEPKQSNRDSDFKEDMPIKLGQKQRIDVSEAFANTINELEILMTEALSMARQATENHNPTQSSSGPRNITTLLNNGQNSEKKFNEKPLNIDHAQKNLQDKTKKSETSYYGAEQTSKPLAEEKNPTDILKSPTDQPKKKSCQPSTDRILTPYRLSRQNLPQNGSEALKFKYPRYSPAQIYDIPAKRPVIRSSAQSAMLQPVIQPDDLSPPDLQKLTPDVSDEVKKTSVVSEPHSVSRISLQDQNSKKGDLYGNKFAKSSQIDKLNVSKPDLNEPINQYDSKKSHSQSYLNFNRIDSRNKSKPEKPLDINKDFSHSLDGSAMTYSDVVDFNSGHGLGTDRTPIIRPKGGIELIDSKSPGLPLLTRSNHKREFSLSGKTHVSLKEHHLKEFSLAKTHKRKPIARDWSPGRKRLVASVACISTALVGILVGIYAGETPAIQYYIVDFHHYTVLGNVLFFFGLAIPTFFAWPLPLLHGRKPYILGAMSLAMPLLFPQALAVGEFRSPYVSIWRVCLILPRAAMGFCLGFANMNFKCILTDLFGASLQSTNPHQEHADEFDVRRHGGGMGAWLGLWTWSALGSIGIGFLIGAIFIDKLSPSWGFYVSIIIIAFVMLLNVVCPEVRRAAYRRSVAQVVTEDVISHRLARGEVKMHMVKIGPKWWGEELQYGIRLSHSMLQQPGFLIMSLYIAWIYGQQVLITVLLGALLSDDYKFRSTLVGLSATAIPLGALVAIPFQKASFFSRSRRNPPLDDDGTLSKKKLHWSSHMIRRAIFVLFLPLFGLFITVTAGGPPIPFILPILGAGVVGFLSNLAMAECYGIIMETFDTSDLEPGMTGRSRDSSSKNEGKPTNYSSFPRVSSAFAIIETFGFIFAAGSSGIGGVLSRKLGRQAAIGLMASVLLVLSILLLGVLYRFTEVQIIPNSRMDDMNQYQARRVSASQGASGAIEDDKEPWRPTIIGNPHQSTRRMCVLELGSMSRFSEIRKKNKLIDQMKLESKHPNRNALNVLERRIKEMEMEIVHNIRRSLSVTSTDSQNGEELETSTNLGRRKLRNLEIEGNRGNIRRKVVGKREILD